MYILSKEKVEKLGYVTVVCEVSKFRGIRMLEETLDIEEDLSDFGEKRRKKIYWGIVNYLNKYLMQRYLPPGTYLFELLECESFQRPPKLDSGDYDYNNLQEVLSCNGVEYELLDGYNEQ